MCPLILVVDDQSGNFNVIEALLHRENYRLEYVSSGEAALAYLELHRPDLILLDMMMPGMDGFTLCRHLKGDRHWQHIPIIAVTALSSSEDLERCLAEGADDFIAKPVDAQELRARIRAMLRIRQQYERLNHLLELQDDLAHMMVHDLRSPLTSIAMSTSVLDRLVTGPLPQKQVQRILASIQRLQCMIDSVLMLGKLKSERLALQVQNISIHELIKDAMDDFQLSANQRGIRIESEVPERGPALWGDLLLLRRLIDNLISNAVKFSPTGGEIRILVDYPNPQRLRVRVTDQGPGVSPELQSRLFQKFEVDSLGTDVQQTGLGLAFCKMAAETHGGSIKVEPNRPVGSVFMLEIDCEPSQGLDLPQNNDVSASQPQRPSSSQGESRPD